MAFDLIIRNGHVVTTAGVVVQSIAIIDGKIVEIGEITGDAKEEIDATGLHVFPGLIDSHVHFNEPGRTEWEGIATGSAALSAGGGTCFFDMPLNSSPPTLDGPSFDLKLKAALASSRTDFALWGGLTPNNLGQLEELADRGVIGFKAFMSNSGISDFERADELTLRKGMQIAAKLGLLVAVHAEDEGLTSQDTAEVVAKGGASWIDYARSRSLLAEKKAIITAYRLAKETGCQLHIVHVSSSVGVFAVDYARYTKVDVTCETCPHYLLLNENDLAVQGAPAKCAPPLRSESMRKLLWGRVRGGMVDFIASDHSPAPKSMKTGDDPFKIWGGISGVQSTLPALLTQEPPLTLERVAALTAANVAHRYRIADKGQIAVGFDADLALLDLDAKYELTQEMLLDRHKLSPYIGRRFRGAVKRTIVRGHTVFLDGKSIGDFRGRLIKPAARGGDHG